MNSLKACEFVQSGGRDPDLHCREHSRGMESQDVVLFNRGLGIVADIDQR